MHITPRAGGGAKIPVVTGRHYDYVRTVAEHVDLSWAATLQLAARSRHTTQESALTSLRAPARLRWNYFPRIPQRDFAGI